jgi:hypothetical protein
MGYAEPLLLIDDEQAKFLEADIFLKQPMSAYYEIDSAVFNIVEGFFI